MNVLCEIRNLDLNAMMETSRIYELGLKLFLAIGLGVALVWPVAAQAPSLAMLDKLDPGLWEVRDRETQDKTRICVRNGRELIQLRHQAKACSRVVVEDAANEVTVQYSCKGDGYGRTNIRRESAILVQIEGQGIAGTRHFEFSAEARRIGTCAR